MEQTKPRFNRLLRPPAWKRSGVYSGRKGRDWQKKKIRKVNEKRKQGKSTKEQKTRKWTDKGGKGLKGGTPASRGVVWYQDQDLETRVHSSSFRQRLGFGLETLMTTSRFWCGVFLKRSWQQHWINPLVYNYILLTNLLQRARNRLQYWPTGPVDSCWPWIFTCCPV